MKKFFILFILSMIAFHQLHAQNVGIGTPAPAAKLQINHRTTAASPSLRLFDSSAGTGSRLVFARESQSNNFTILSTIDLFAINNSLDIRTTFNSGIFLRGDGRVGINNITSPAAILHVGGGVKINDTLNVTGDVNFSGKLKLGGNAGTDKQVLVSNGISYSPTWESIGSVSGTSVGFGPWGDCSMNAVSEYNPAIDTTGAVNDFLGTSVSISGNFAIVGSRADDIGANANQGSASIFQFDGDNWIFMQKLTDATGAADDFFGYSVSISGNFAIVGAQGDDVGGNLSQGSVSIFQYNGTNWALMQKITDAAGATNDFFGTGVSISGNHAIVGSPGAEPSNRGSVLFYQFNGTNWVLILKTFTNSLSANDALGTSVSISGNFAVAGSPGINASGVSRGGANVYQYNGSTWVLTQTITDANGSDNDNLGTCVSGSENLIIVGAPNADVSSNDRQGVAIIFGYNGSSWVLMKRLTDPDGDLNYDFGSSVSVSGNYAIVGSSGDDRLAANRGSSIIYQRIGPGWQRMQFVTDPGGDPADLFGSGVAIDGSSKRFMIGAPGFAASSGKVVFGKIN